MTEAGLRDRIAKLAGGHAMAGVLLDKIADKHAKGYGGRITLEDRTINEHVLRERALRGTTHIVLSRHKVDGICVELVTDLGQRRTTIRSGVDPFGQQAPRRVREDSDATR